MNIKAIVLSATLLLVAFPALAVMSYPQIAGITISNTTTASEYIIYFFNLVVAVGAFIAVIMVVMAGIEWMTSDGNPSKIESAKGKIKNTLLGVAVLLGCYVILDMINPDLKTIKINKLYCQGGIVVLPQPTTAGGETKQACIQDTMSSIPYTIQQTIEWDFPADSILKVYTYSEPNFIGTRTEYSCKNGCNGKAGEIAGSKSIYFLHKKAGLYLYDETNYKLGSKPYPYYLSSSAKLPVEFENFIKSIDIVQPDELINGEKAKYMAVLFDNPDYTGKCSFIAEPEPDLSVTQNAAYYSTPIGNKTLSSLIITKSYYDSKYISEERGEVILYTNTDCARSSSDPTKQIKACHIPVYYGGTGHKNIIGGNNMDPFSYCKEFVEGDEVMSLEITGQGAVVLSTGTKDVGGYCAYFDINTIKPRGCYSDLRKTPVFYDEGEKPKSFIVFPVD